ncbi:MAG: CPBP family intramembrane metalloprotease [Gemmatimonadetes bacterium]|nr:CPBP family intramembrane metalloprotease [Gemmatimonadota bacterium]
MPNPESQAPQGGALNAREAAALQLAPGVATLLVYLPLAALLSSRGIPNLVALMLAVLVAEVPVSWAIMTRRVRRETGGRFTLRAAFPWHAKVRWWQYTIIGVPLILISVAIVGALNPVIELPLLSGPFAWVPDWFVLRFDPAMFTELSRGLVLKIWGLAFVSFVLVAPTQELYARGFLLPRTAHWGARAPAFNALLFAIFHLIAPWSWVGFFIMALPWAYLVWWRRSVKIGLFIHVGMIVVQWLGMTALIFGLAPTP